MKKINPEKYEALRAELRTLNTKHKALLALFDKQNAAYADAEKTIQRLITENEAPLL